MKLRDLLELCRVSNLPTVWSNSLLGLLAGLYIFEGFRQNDLIGHSLPIAIFGVLFALAMSLIYCGGMVMNDWVDREVDANERPNRPIPSGRVSAKHAQYTMFLMFFWGVVLVMFTTGLGALSPHGIDATISALVLIAFVALYNYSHQRSPIAVLFMGLCRALIILCGVLLAGDFERLTESPDGLIFLIGPAATLLIYTVLISVVARREVEHDSSAAQPHRFVFLPRSFGGPKTVMNMIAAMPLLDAVWLVVMGFWPASLFCVACAGMSKLAHRKVAGS